MGALARGWLHGTRFARGCRADMPRGAALWRRSVGLDGGGRRDSVAPGAAGRRAGGAGLLRGPRWTSAAGLLAGGAGFVRVSREARTGLARERRKKGGMSRPGAPIRPCDRGRRRVQMVRGASCPRALTINIPDGDLRCGRGPRPTPGRPAGLRVLAHTHNNVYPSTSSTPPVPCTGRSMCPVAPVARPGSERITSNWKSLAHCGLAAIGSTTRAAPTGASRPQHSQLHYPVRVTLPSSFIANRRTGHFSPAARCRASSLAKNANARRPDHTGSGRFDFR